MKERITKKSFQGMLNKMDLAIGNTYGAITKGWKHNQYHQSKRLYGDYLRAQDPDMFNANYHEYLNGGHQHLKEYE